MGFAEGQTDLPPQSAMNDQTIEPICRKYAELRYKLIPYTYTLAAEARDSGLPMMRAMWLHYPADERARGLGSQYLWGRDLLVAPVFTKGATTRDVYLPAGDWYDWWTGEMVAGGKSIERKVDLETMPLFARAGAIVPIDPLRQYLSQPVTEPTTVRVYSGADGEFRLYEDDGASQEYLQGKFAWTRLTWNNAAQRLSIERDRKSGTLNAPPRKLVVQLLPGGKFKEIIYDGERAEVAFQP
jgi:alpha-glucosidase/alpha-D-xyloside xylohydrolase